MAKILYAAGTYAHIKSFHLPYIKALRAQGHRVLVMANGEEADFNVAFEKKMFSLRNAQCQHSIRRILKAEKFDAIILNTTLAAFNIRMALPRKGRPRVVNLMHGYMFSEEPSGLKERIFLFAERFLKSKTDSIIVMNDEDLRSAYRYSLTSGDIKMIRGMGAKIHEQTESPEIIRKRLNSSDKYVIVFTGELCEFKNQRLLISALPKIRESIPNAVLWLLGVGGAEEELRELAKELSVSDSVHFAGYVANPTDYVKAADLYVAPSRKEGLPFNVVEALGAAKPIVASDVKGHRDLIEDGVSGLLFKKDSMEEMIEAILSIYTKKVVINSEAQAEAYLAYSFDEVFEETLSIMTELMDVKERR